MAIEGNVMYIKILQVLGSSAVSTCCRDSKLLFLTQHGTKKPDSALTSVLQDSIQLFASRSVYN